MKIGESWYPPVINVPERKQFLQCAIAAVVVIALFAGIGVLLAWRG